MARQACVHAAAETLTNDFFVDLLDMNTAGEVSVIEACSRRDRGSGALKWTRPLPICVRFELAATLTGGGGRSSDGQPAFVGDFVARGPR